MSQSDHPTGVLSRQAKRRLLAQLLRRQASQGRQLSPMSQTQKVMWMLSRFDPEAPPLVAAFAARVLSAVDPEAMKEAFRSLVDHHAMLRTTYQPRNGDPCMVIHGYMEPVFEHVDASLWDEEELRRRVREFYYQPIDLEHGPIVRVGLFTRDRTDHVLLFVVHHIACDGWALGILLREFRDLYQAQVTGLAGESAPAAAPYTEFVRRQHAMLAGEEGARHRAYWEQQLAGPLSALELPADRPRSRTFRFRRATHLFTLEPSTYRKLLDLSQGQGMTLFTPLLAAYQIFLMRYSGQEDVLVGVPMVGRGRSEEEGTVGNFVEMALMRGDCSGNPPVREFLARTWQAVLNAMDHQEYPMSEVVRHLREARRPIPTPLFSVTLNLLGTALLASLASVLERTDSQEALPWGPLVLKPYPLEKQHEAREQAPHDRLHDLAIKAFDTGRTLLCEMHYPADLFELETIHQFHRSWETLLAALVDNPDTPIAHLPILHPADYQKVVVDWNQTAAAYPRESSIHSLFEAQAARRPQAVAVTLGGRNLTYGELNTRANQVAHYLKKLGVGPEALVGIAVERSLRMVVGLLGILKAGAAYLPLDPLYPRERLAFMLRDARVPVLLTQTALLDRMPVQEVAQVVCLDRDWERITAESASNPDVGVAADCLAYVNYTSGSTGQPKGVAIPHRAVVRLLFGSRFARLDETQRILQAASISFDAATFEIWGALLHGGCCVLFPGRIPTIKELGAVIAGQRVSLMWLTSAQFNIIVNEAPKVLAPLRQLLIGGEALSADHVRRALECLPDTELINGYGPTEGTTFTCCYPIPRNLGAAVTSVPIGRPIANTRVYVLDRHLQPLPVGVPGELYIGGDGLARGYVNRPELTAEQFVADPFRADAGARLYRTGDLVRYLPDGNLVFLGRLDHQVKIRGFRIEPGEVESALARHPRLRQSVVVARTDERGDKRLVAFGVPADADALPTLRDVQDFLKPQLPEYMIPSGLVMTRKLPLTGSGKVDRQALQTYPLPETPPAQGHVPPGNPTQALLVQIWEELLAVRPIGILDDFFELGGHSLLLLSLLARIEELFGRTLPLASLFTESTVLSMAQALVAGAAESPLVEVQQGTGRPLFFWHGDYYGGGLYCRNLVRHLGAAQRFCVIQPHGLAGQRPPTTFEAMAADHLALLRACQPQGPYLLGGYCNGALVAFEMARQLRAAGEQVDLLALIASPEPNRHAVEITDLESRLPPGASDSAQEDSSPPGRRQALLRLCLKACLSYVPGTYPGRVTLFLPSEEPGLGTDPSGGWRRVAGEVEVHGLPGNHTTIITRHAAVVAEQLRACLLQAQHQATCTILRVL